MLWYLTSWRAETVEVLTQVALPDPLSEVVQVAERSLNAFCLILKWLFSKCLYSTFFCVFTMYGTGWAKTKRARDCIFTIMAEISGRY